MKAKGDLGMYKVKVDYLLRSAVNFFQKRKCPFCQSEQLRVIDRKYMVTALLQCDVCGLNHRHPRDSEAHLQKFYQEAYKVNNRNMTKLPSDEEIRVMKATNFGKSRSFGEYIRSLITQREHIRVVDYGCSWGYSVYKLISEGFDATGFELSRPRVNFGREKLDVPIFSDLSEMPYELDVVISSHVIEHLGDINELINFAKGHLKPDGLFIAFCPNGGESYAKREEHIWRVNWGNVHPNHLSVEFAGYAFRENPYLILTDDWVFDQNKISGWNGKDQVTDARQNGKELLIIAKPNIKMNTNGIN